MPAINVKIALRYQFWLFILIAISFLSGVGFFILSEFFNVMGEFGQEKHPAGFTILKIHGGAAFLMMATYGFFLGGHVKKAWKMKTKPIFGIITAILPLLLMITGYLLYYIAADLMREIVEYTHLGIGVLLPIILTAHILNPPSKNKKQRRLRDEKN
ncbi:MAG: hypothetical protein ACJAW3_001374 [Lentimonas sp.]